MFRKNLLVAIPLFVVFSLSTSGCEKTSSNQGNVSTCGYKLPWSNSLGKVEVLQGNNDKLTHKAEDSMAYAFDFDLPEGTPVLATRGGTVSYVQTDKSACGGQELENKANYVVVDHGDGTSALYLHLQGVEVKQGQKVVQGQVLGYSGKTGWTGCTPHLHFQVQKTTNSWFGESVPICFDGVGVPQKGQAVVSENKMVAVLGMQVSKETPTPSPVPFNPKDPHQVARRFISAILKKDSSIFLEVVGEEGTGFSAYATEVYIENPYSAEEFAQVMKQVLSNSNPICKGYRVVYEEYSNCSFCKLSVIFDGIDLSVLGRKQETKFVGFFFLGSCEREELKIEAVATIPIFGVDWELSDLLPCS